MIALRTRAVGANLPGANQADLAGDNALLARIFQVQKKWQAAAGAWETVAAIQDERVRRRGPASGRYAGSPSDCRFEMQLVDPAVDALRRALVIRELNLGTVNADVAATTDHLGKILYYAKRFSEAEPYFQRTLDIDLKLPGSDNPELARAYDNLAVTEAMLEKYAEAETHYREALKLRDADDTLSLRNLALVLTAQNKNAEAQPLYSRAWPSSMPPEQRRSGVSEDNPHRVLHAAARSEAPGRRRKARSAAQAGGAKQAPVAAKQ